MASHFFLPSHFPFFFSFASSHISFMPCSSNYLLKATATVVNYLLVILLLLQILLFLFSCPVLLTLPAYVYIVHTFILLTVIRSILFGYQKRNILLNHLLLLPIVPLLGGELIWDNLIYLVSLSNCHVSYCFNADSQWQIWLCCQAMHVVRALIQR